MNNEMSEMNRQCKMAWERGHDYGVVKGLALSFIGFGILLILLGSIK